ncbi:MAG: phospho-N-acetylmuramoyl-pentapeptide-transferase [Limnochordia bacterium]|jgi:phospho-N-acetylmuramoyl-pentapeptide-transferase
MQEGTVIITAGITAFIIVLILGPGAIRYLYRLKFGQEVRSDGPAAHRKKQGTPTMGGVMIIAAAVTAALLMADEPALLPLALFVSVGYGLIGMIDDYIIVVTKRSLGLKARQKLIGQILIALAVVIYALNEPRLGPSLLVPFTGSLIYLPEWLYVLFSTLTVVFIGNAVNITDGCDGLAAGSTAIAAIAYSVIAYMLGAGDMAIFAAAVAGACFGFSWFNAYPAQVFMGDTGSLALGGALGAMAVLTKTQLLLYIVGGLFVIEALSVILQVAYFRVTHGKRIFRMSPLHHHFELSGWSETKVTVRFWLIAMLFGLIGYIAL